MTPPVYKVEVWEPGAGSALYSIDDAFSIYSKEILTDGIGHFSFVVPTKKGVQEKYRYNDIDAFDIVKIWYGTTSGDPTFIGRVGMISATLEVNRGYVRVISGPSQGEILQRRFKKNKIWSATDASQIATDVATDLGILHAADIDADTNDITLEVATKSYFDILREISDYWYDATHKVQKDFWLHTDGHLHWKARPVRTAGVESFAVGENILSYNVTQQIDPVKNNISTFGQAGDIGIPGLDGRCDPANKDLWTVDNIANWHLTAGDAVVSDPVANVVGVNHIRGDTTAGPFTVTFHRHFSTPYVMFGNSAYKTLNFYMKTGLGSAPVETVRLLAPDFDNYYEVTVGLGIASGWVLKQYQLGENQTYDATYKPTGIWVPHGSPTWDDIEGIEFYYDCGDQTSIHIDALFFGHGRFRGTASDLVGAGSSGVLYGQRDLELVDDRLKSDSDCTKRAETILLTSKALPKQIEVSVRGSTNVLIGDRVPLTIPAENLSAADYDIICVEQTFIPGSASQLAWTTKATMVNSLDTRQLLEVSPLNMIANLKRAVRTLVIDAKRL